MKKLLLELQTTAQALDPNYDLSLSWGMFSKLWTALLIYGDKKHYIGMSADPEEALERLKIKLLDKSSF